MFHTCLVLTFPFSLLTFHFYLPAPVCFPPPAPSPWIFLHGTPAQQESCCKWKEWVFVLLCKLTGEIFLTLCLAEVLATDEEIFLLFSLLSACSMKQLKTSVYVGSGNCCGTANLYLSCKAVLLVNPTTQISVQKYLKILVALGFFCPLNCCFLKN